MSRTKPLNDTQIKFLLRVQQGAILWMAYRMGAKARMSDSRFNWSAATMDYMIRNKLIALPGRIDADRRIRLTEEGARLADGLRTSWPHLAQEVAA